MERLNELFESAAFKNVVNKINSKVIRILISIDKQITKNLLDCQIETRPCKTNGLWCCVLLPAVLVLYSTLYQVSELYTLLAFISIGLLAYSVLFMIFISVSCLVLKENIFGACGASSLLATLLLYATQTQGLIFSLVCSITAVYAVSALLRMALTKYPRTFTIGEATVVAQSIVLFGIMVFSKIFFNMSDEQDDEMKVINAIIFAVLSSVGIIVTALSILDDSQKNISSVLCIVAAAGIYALIILHLQCGVTCILQIGKDIALNPRKIKLILFWLCLVFISVLVVLKRSRDKAKASTVTRKSFHILASMVFLSGIVFDIRLMTLAAGVGFGLIILIEALRKFNIETISPALQTAFEVYSDEKDGGSFAMTPIYLYVGLACPLLLVPVHPGYKVELLSGILSIGIGDTGASWFGSKYGQRRWAGGQKTLEGTLFNIFSQVAVMFLLGFFGLMNVPNGVLRVAITATISGLVEAKTDQVDNLVLPLVTLIAFQATSVLCRL